MMDKKTLGELLKNCHERLQDLNIQPTQGNMEILLQTLYDLKQAYRGLEEVDDEQRTEADPERQPED